MVDAVVESALRTPESVRGAVKAFELAGVDELVSGPIVASVDEVDHSADVVR